MSTESAETPRWQGARLRRSQGYSAMEGNAVQRGVSALECHRICEFDHLGRGESVVTGDLVAALQNHRIAGAALDVTDPEPLPPGHPLWSMPNVVLMPHTGAGSDQVVQRALTLVTENLRRYVNGEKMLSVVDVKRGY